MLEYAKCTVGGLEDGVASASDVTSRLRKYGAAKLNGFFATSLIAEILARFTALYAERQRMADAGALPKELQKHFAGGGTLLDDIVIEGQTAGDLLSQPILYAVGESLLGHVPQRSRSSFVRSIAAEPGGHRLPFHQDQKLTGFPLVNVWLPLTPSGVVAPGLEVVLTDKTDLLETFSEESHRVVDRNQISRDLLVESFGEDALWHPTFEPGDAMIFRGSTVHRTYVTPGMTQARTSIELRLV